MPTRWASRSRAASCAYILVLREIAGNEPQAQARMLQGLVTGMGFIGGGAILKG